MKKWIKKRNKIETKKTKNIIIIKAYLYKWEQNLWN